MLSYESNINDIVARDPELAIIPLASIEQHGPHLPVGTDWYIANALGRGVAERTGGYLLPSLPISTCKEHMGKKGSVWMDPDVFYSMMNSIFKSLQTQGFKKVATIQCHGGIFVMPPLVRQINATLNPEFMAVNVDVCNAFGAMEKEGLTETATELHAGEIETSLILHIAPETVQMDKAVDFVPTSPRSFLNYGSIFRASPSGVWGDATKGTAEKGKKLLERAVELITQEINASFAFMEEKEKFGYSHF